jgi:hypothetical protein
VPCEERCEKQIESDGALRQCVKRWAHDGPCKIGDSAAGEMQRLWVKAGDRMKVAVEALEEIERHAWAGRNYCRSGDARGEVLERIEQLAKDARAEALKLADGTVMRGP